MLQAVSQIILLTTSLESSTDTLIALFQTLVQLGGSFGLSLTAVIYDAFAKKSLASGASSVDSILAGLRAAFWLGAGCSFTAMIASIGFLRGMGIIGKGVGKKEGVKEKRDTSGKVAVEEKV